MRATFGLLACLAAISLGCHQGMEPTAPAVEALAVTPNQSPALFQRGESVSGLFAVQVDPACLSATITTADSRNAQAQPPQALSYDIDISKFVKSPNLLVRRVSQDPDNHDLILTIEFRHPFQAPNFAGSISAKNRADLGFTGRLLILADQNRQSLAVPGEGTYRFDPTYVVNPDGYCAVVDLLRQSGITSNLLPYRLLADEALDDRAGVSNGGVMTGNYNAATGGWQQANAGTGSNGWTGYDYIHGGQVVDTTLVLNFAALASTAFQFKMA
ncbi:MAG: hypothetical protein ABI743_05125, partial [bacterium]